MCVLCISLRPFFVLCACHCSYMCICRVKWFGGWVAKCKAGERIAVDGNHRCTGTCMYSEPLHVNVDYMQTGNFMDVKSVIINVHTTVV